MFKSGLVRLHFLWQSIGVDVSLSGALFVALLQVCFDVKVEKEEEKHGAVEDDDVAEDLGEVALDKEGKGGVQEKGDKLDKL